jgi:catalase
VATTPKDALGKIDDRFGVHARHRALHAKGVICKATFTATPEAAGLTRAGHMTGEPIPTTARISNGGGDPTVADYEPDVRGLATAFHLPDGTRTDILAQTLPRFPFRDQEGFLDVLAISKPSASALLKFPRFAVKYPKAIKQLPETTRILNSRASFAARRYYPFHAFKWIDAGGGERYVRYAWLPTIDEPDISKSEAKRRGPNYLFDDLEQRLDRAPVRWDLAVQIAGEGDDPHDPSSVWPEERERVIVGTLEVTGIDPDADDGIVMDPVRLVDGIEASGDPALLYRPPVYDLSHTRRTAG